jgi:hypothetical protein
MNEKPLSSNPQKKTPFYASIWKKRSVALFPLFSRHQNSFLDPERRRAHNGGMSAATPRNGFALLQRRKLANALDFRATSFLFKEHITSGIQRAYSSLAISSCSKAATQGALSSRKKPDRLSRDAPQKSSI